MLQQFRIVPAIHVIDTCKEFCQEFQIGEKDLILTNPSYFEGYLSDYVGDAHVIYMRKYGSGEPTDLMVEALCKYIEDVEFDRVIGIGGGSILDVAKLLVQEKILPLDELFDTKATHKVKRLVLVPTTCGTGSEVTSVSVINMTRKGSKIGLQTDEEYADDAVLIPELLSGLPYKFFATSSIDALVHAVESFLSPRATVFSEMYAEKAIRMILDGYMGIHYYGKDEREKRIKAFLLASTYAGISFGNAGTGAVHAMSMPYSGAHHVPHGEANYVLFVQILKTYKRLRPEGKIEKLENILAEVFESPTDSVFVELERLLNVILPLKALHEYGVTKDEIPGFVKIVDEKQGRLTKNNYTKLNDEEMTRIYEEVL